MRTLHDLGHAWAVPVGLTVLRVGCPIAGRNVVCHWGKAAVWDPFGSTNRAHKESLNKTRHKWDMFMILCACRDSPEHVISNKHSSEVQGAGPKSKGKFYKSWKAHLLLELQIVFFKVTLAYWDVILILIAIHKSKSNISLFKSINLT